MVSVHVIASVDEFLEACDVLERGFGPVAIDAERASGFTYSQRAYLIQVHRRDAGTFLFDPPAIGSLRQLTSSVPDEEWVLHAASQDLACLRDVGIDPPRIFDTELSARLLGMPKVGLGSVMAEVLDVHLAKEHSAVDWSTRPLPDPWLAYAVGDVERLVDLRDAMHEMLREADKLDWALSEFEATRTKPEKPALDEPWRRLSGLHTLRQPRQLAVARALWLARDKRAQALDVSPGRLIPDAAIVAAAAANLSSQEELARLKTFTGRASRSELPRWWQAVAEGQVAADLPVLRVPTEGPPHPRSWKDKRPEAAARLDSAKPAIRELAETHNVPTENLISPAVVRELCWEPPDDLSESTLTAALEAAGARAWQAQLVAPVLVEAFARSAVESETDTA